ncbi:MAG TPA: ArsA family ATPase [Thermoanaerobaculia bacterium]|nr:ArsA family ATPase [Thermoanaerobaculia bacterium]
MRPSAERTTFLRQTEELSASIEPLTRLSLLLFGGKGGVGKTTIASLAALLAAAKRRTILFSTDPASSLGDLFDTLPAGLTLESLDADRLYGRFLELNLATLLELGDRGTYLDKEELRRFLQLSLPGVDELMAWMRIAELVEEDRERLVIVDTAPTGHTLRMLSSSAHIERFGEALESMQAKHRELVAQLARRRIRDAIDDFIDDFRTTAEARSALFRDPERTAFVAVMLAEPWVVEQTQRLIAELRDSAIAIPLVIVNQAVHDCECDRCRSRAAAEGDAVEAVRPVRAVRAPRSCYPLDRRARLERYLMGKPQLRVTAGRASEPRSTSLDVGGARLLFFAGKGGVGKTTAATSVALQLADGAPDRRFSLVSVDPAHSLRDVFSGKSAPPNLNVEIIDTKSRWAELRETIGSEIERALDALTPSGFSLRHDQRVMDQLLDIGPPGADEIFAVMRIHELLVDGGIEQIIVDTAPTGHFLRLLDLPKTAGGWIREMMRILLRYRELIPPGALGEELLHASRALKKVMATLQSNRTVIVAVTRAETIVVAETQRLLTELKAKGILQLRVVANHLTPESSCRCDRDMRRHELALLETFPGPVTLVERRGGPVTSFEDLRKLIPLGHTEPR